MLQQNRKRTFGGRLARRVGIVVHNNAAREAAEQLHLRFREARTAARHDVADPRPRHRDRIHVTLDENRRICRANGFLGTIQVIKHAALDVDRRLRRVQILGQIVPQGAPAESDHFAGLIGDREDNAPAETVVGAPVCIAAGQSGQLH